MRIFKKGTTYAVGISIVIALAVILLIDSDAPEIYGESAIVVDIDNNKIIYAKNIDKRLYPASTTKLMTALIMADRKTENDIFNYSERVRKLDGRKLVLPPGEKISAKEAMNAMLIFSANDVAHMIGENIGGSVEKFAETMNKKAMELDLQDTNFMNPSGLPDENHYTTALDLSKIAMEVAKYPWIMDTISKDEHMFITETRKIQIPINNTNLLLGINGCNGGKTGHTDAAGWCLVSFYERDGKRLVGVVMKSQDQDTVFKDMEVIIDWSYDRIKEIKNINIFNM